MKKVFSGIQPTGNGIPHIGNYFGAIKSYVELQEKYESYFCIVDQHATTVNYNPSELRSNTLNTAKILLSCGLDSMKSVLYCQSSVPGHSLLANILGHIATIGPLERMTQYKDKAKINDMDNERQKEKQRNSIGLGLLTYPVLMASDILLFKADYIPVGDDQHQHLQLTCELAKRFNHKFGDYFPIPEKYFQPTSRIMSLQDPTKKMSKSSENKNSLIYLNETMETVSKKYKKAASDSDFIDDNLEERPALKNLVNILSAMTGEDSNSITSRLHGLGFSSLKNELIEAHEHFILPIANRYNSYCDDDVMMVLSEGQSLANNIANKTVEDVYNIVGYNINKEKDVELINSVKRTYDMVIQNLISLEEYKDAYENARKGHEENVKRYLLNCLSTNSDHFRF